MKAFVAWFAIALGSYAALGAGYHAYLIANPLRIAVIVDSSYAMRPVWGEVPALLESFQRKRYVIYALMTEKMKKTDPFIKALITMLLGNLRSVHESYTPKARSLVDSVSTLARQSDSLTKYLTDNEDMDLPVDIAVKVGELNSIIGSLSEIAEKHKSKDRRGDAMPPANPPA